jgi:RND superfamily putative drug exporter
LFDLSGLSDQLTYDLQESAVDSATTTNGNGKQKVDRYLGHSLPLFGPGALSHTLITVGANGNGHANGKANGNGHANGNSDGDGNADQASDQDVSQPLPLFGANE